MIIKKIKIAILFLIAILISSQSYALENENGAVFVRIIDSGAGLATITSMPGGYYMVYDAGHWNGKTETMQGISSVIPEGEEIDLLILSHGDSDHIVAVPNILGKYKVKTIIRGGLERQTNTWTNADKAIKSAENSGETKVINLKRDHLPFGSKFNFGETLITFVSGFYAPPVEWGIKGKTSGEFRNAGSIVIQLSYKGKSILYTGDAVGRDIGDPAGTLIATEKFMVDNADTIGIDSDVLIAPHHGGDNASTEGFIKSVSPTFVIFSAGHEYKHPRKTTAKRYLDYGVSLKKIFRTDLGDDEGVDEWDEGRILGNIDGRGDDDVDILIRENGEVVVDYRE